MYLKTISKLLCMTICLYGSVIACGPGVPRIENGEWANKDSIYSNCEKCYEGNEQEIRDCKAMYNRTAEEQIVEYESARKQALSVLPGLISEAKHKNFTTDILCYFPFKYPGCQHSKDTLDAVLKLSKSDLEKIDVKTLVRYQEFLGNLNERVKDFDLFQKLLETRPKELKEKEIKLNILSMVLYGKTEDRVLDVNHWLFLFGMYSDFAAGCPQFESFKALAESNPLLYVIYTSQSLFGQNNRIFNNSDFTNVTYESLKKGLEACLKLKGEEEKIAYGNDWVYDESVGNTIWALTRLYDKEVLGAVTDDERKKKEAEFKAKLPLDYIQPIINDMIKYQRHIQRQLTFGTQTGEMFLKLKRIYNFQ